MGSSGGAWQAIRQRAGGIASRLAASRNPLLARRLAGRELLRPGAHEPVNGYEVLEKLAHLPVSTWSYVFDPPTVRHLGPMSQDFWEAFHLGETDRMINLIDANGVAVVSIQALYRRVVALEAEVHELRASVSPQTPDVSSSAQTEPGPEAHTETSHSTRGAHREGHQPEGPEQG